jgi:hypothetical protein
MTETGVRRLYIEALIQTDLDTLWRYTQDPAAHTRWDARFGEIAFVPGNGPQRFRYTTFGVAGTGTCAGERTSPDGGCVSALRFASGNVLSPIRAGSGYWRYVPTPDGIRFITGYDYQAGWGKVPDLLVRPLVGWLTAWSFDRLRLWLERGVPPERSRNHAVAHAAARGALVAVAAARHGAACGAVTAALMLGLPTAPGIPSARRCRRRPPGRVGASQPALLDRLEQA